MVRIEPVPPTADGLVDNTDRTTADTQSHNNHLYPSLPSSVQPIAVKTFPGLAQRNRHSSVCLALHVVIEQRYLPIETHKHEGTENVPGMVWGAFRNGEPNTWSQIVPELYGVFESLVLVWVAAV